VAFIKFSVCFMSLPYCTKSLMSQVLLTHELVLLFLSLCHIKVAVCQSVHQSDSIKTIP